MRGWAWCRVSLHCLAMARHTPFANMPIADKEPVQAIHLLSSCQRLTCRPRRHPHQGDQHRATSIIRCEGGCTSGQRGKRSQPVELVNRRLSLPAPFPQHKQGQHDDWPRRPEQACAVPALTLSSRRILAILRRSCPPKSPSFPGISSVCGRCCCLPYSWPSCARSASAPTGAFRRLSPLAALREESSQGHGSGLHSGSCRAEFVRS